MFKRLLLMTMFMIFSVEARVLSGHQEFVHYSNEQKETFIIKVMELMVELENKYETAPAPEKKKYSLLLRELREMLINSAYAAETDLASFANDLTTLLDPNIEASNRCIYAGWVSRTTPVIDHRTGRREVCQHPKFLRNGRKGGTLPETQAYNKSSDCGQKNQNTIACNPAIFGFKNQQQGSQFCVPAGPAHSENSSYACMQLALGVKKEAGADAPEKRIEYLKKQFEGSPALLNNLFGFIYKTCICDTQETEVINQIYLNNTRPHRTCLGLVNTIAEVNHCVEFNTVKSSEMELFKGIRSFTNDLAGQSSGRQVDSKYKELLGSLKSHFSSDYARICGGDLPPPIQEGGGDGTGEADNSKECIGECDLEDGKLVRCTFKSGEETLDVTPPDDTSREFKTKINEEEYLCKINERSIDHGASCSLSLDGETVSYSVSSANGVEVKVVATHWSPAQEGAVSEKATFGDANEVSLTIDIEVKGKKESIACGSVPKKTDAPKIELIPDGEDDKTQKFKTEVTPDDNGWTYTWSRTHSTPPKDSGPGLQLQGDSNGEEGTPPAEEEPESDGKTSIDHNGKSHDAPKEEENYQVCVKLTKEGEEPSNESCQTVGKLKDKSENDQAPAAKPNVGGPRLPQMPQPMRRGVDFSRGGVL
ncbi:MAG: hypothetical protein WDA09_07695 [Bacteriovoracaceae bacterium]